ncbi:MAG: LON peptidase substrate-binding domain-containing protein, partial [Candidatus Dormibacteraeota bacterium]|nr:LON peptidase substrate-binding domain-containing protein [Candidatus Dormibacteraeota bacterium]
MSQASKRPPRELPVLPLKNTVVFPQVVVPLAVGRPRSLQLLEDLPAGERTLAVSAQLDENIDEATWEQVYRVGTVVRIEHMIKLPDGTVQLAVRGLQRVRLEPVETDRPYLVARLRAHPERAGRAQPPLEREALTRSAIASFQQLVAIAPYLPGELLGAALSLDDQLQLAYFLATHVRISVTERQQILELSSARDKLQRLLGLIGHELEVLELGRKIQSQAEESIGKSQREYYLREQLKAIQHELGEVDQDAAEAAELRERIEKAGLPAEARREADRELA